MLVSIVASAAPPAAASPSRRPVTPWSKGVSDAAQTRALQLFQQGNTFLEQTRYTEAVAKYEQALKAWDHPNIRFNMAICLINMRQPLAAWDHLTHALRFGDAPLGKRLHAEAMTYQAALQASLAELTIKSTQPDVTITVDGVQLLIGPGERTTKLLAGRHQVVATRPGYVTDTRALDLPAGSPVIAELELVPEAVRVEIQRENYERRWPWWAPWSIAGGSVVLGVTGGLFYQSARNEIRRYDALLRDMCPNGCPAGDIPADLTRRKTTAERRSGIAIALFSTAGVLAVASGVAAILNRPRKIEDPAPSTGRSAVVPSLTVSADYVGAAVSLAFE